MPDRKEHTVFLKKAYILSSLTRLFLMSETVTRFFFFVSKDNHIVHIRTYDEEMLLTKKGDTIRIKCYETGKCDEADNLNVAIIKKYNP